jgi:Helix-turn-helix domain
MENQRAPLAVGLNEAATMLNVSRRTVEGYIACKLLPARKIGRRTVVLIRSLEHFLRRDQPSPSSKASSDTNTD